MVVDLTNDQKKYIKYILVVFMAMAAGFVACILYANRIMDHDQLWHYRLGEYICQNHEIFKQDIYSWLAIQNGYQETAHSWLGSIITYLSYDVFMKMLHLDILQAGIYVTWVSVFLTCIMIYFMFYKERQDFYLGYLVGCILFAINAAMFKPKIIGYILFIIMLYLFKVIRRDFKKRYWLILLSVFWANLHGGSIPMFFAFIGIYAFSYLLRYNSEFFITGFKPKKKICDFKSFFDMCLIMLHCIIAGCINPYGYKLYLYFCVTNNSEMKQCISEFQPIAGSDLSMWLIAIEIILLAMNREFFRKKYDLYKMLIFLVCVVLSFKYVRISYYAVILMALDMGMLFPAIYRVRFKKDAKFEDGELERICFHERILLNFMMIAISIFISIVSCVFIFIAKPDPMQVHILSENDSAYLKEHDYKRLLNSYDDGAVLIYNGIPCFIDPRADLYRNGEITRTLSFMNTVLSEDEIDAFLEEYDFDCIMVNKRAYKGLIAYMNLRDDYNLDHEGDDYVFYTKAVVE